MDVLNVLVVVPPVALLNVHVRLVMDHVEVQDVLRVEVVVVVVKAAIIVVLIVMDHVLGIVPPVALLDVLLVRLVMDHVEVQDVLRVMAVV